MEKKLTILEESEKGYLIDIPIIGPTWIDKNKLDYFNLLYEDML